MKTLADLKRYLAKDGATLQLVSREHLNSENVWVSATPFNTDKRKVAKLQTNSVSLVTPTNKSGVSWLDFGKASEWTFDGNKATTETNHFRMTYLVEEN